MTICPGWSLSGSATVAAACFQVPVTLYIDTDHDHEPVTNAIFSKD